LQQIVARSETVAEQTLQASRTEQALTQVIRNIQAITDEEISQVRQTYGRNVHIDCRAGCAACCHRTVKATIPEVLAIAIRVQEQFTTDQVAALQEKAKTYAARKTEQPDSREPACPFLKEKQCSIYAVRPLSCRALNSTDVKACEQALELNNPPQDVPMLQHQDAVAQANLFGLRLGLFSEAMDHEDVDLGLALGMVLETDLAGSYLNGSNVIAAAKLTEPEDPIAAPSFASRHTPLITSTPTGKVSRQDEDSLKQYYDLGLKHGRFKDALETLDIFRPTHAIANIIVPRVYDSEDEIAEWRGHFKSALANFAQACYDPIESFNALSMHRTAGLAYQGMLDKEIMIEHGRIMREVTRKAVPDLTERISKASPTTIKVGYISANMHGSNGCRWSLGWLRNHGQNIETFALNVGTVHDSVSQQFKAHAHHYFHLVRTIPENARFIKSLGLDILIFTDIGLHGYNTSYATMRLAPVQCTAWGHPVTSGYPDIDYYLSSDLMEPDDADEHYSEKLIRLPGSGLFYDEVERAPDLNRAHFGLPDSGKIIVNIQTKPKLLPQHDYLYKQIAEKTGAPIVILEGIQPCDTIVTKRRMERAGVPTIWLPHLKRGEFLALLKLADVSLDPPLWSGGNTTIEALSLGTPVVTLAGPWMRSRHSYAFLKQAGAEQLIASTPEEYVQIACDFERQKEAMARMNISPIFRDPEPVKALDQFFADALDA
jgi:predicted O-linked N-acetylglucosamine transferase (SPINDLY family)/Fe-S-cluster containining protein